MKSKARYIAYSGLMLALCVLFQSLRVIFPFLATVPIVPPFDLSVLVVGTLVNLTLIVSVWTVGFWCGAAISALAPVIAFLQGFQKNPFMLIVIIAGNLSLVTVCYLLRSQKPFAVFCGASLKFLAQYGLLALVVAPLFIPEAKNLLLLFSWPQLVTAVLGAVLALLVWPKLKKLVK